MPPLRSRKTEAKESEAFHSFCLFVKGVLEVPSESVGHGKRVGIVYVGKCLINEYIYNENKKYIYSMEYLLSGKNNYCSNA